MVEGQQLLSAAEGDAQVEAEAIDAELDCPAAEGFENQAAAEGLVGGDGIAATADIEVIATTVLVVVGGIRKPAPAQGRPGLIAFGGVVVDHIQQHFQTRLMAGGDELAHLVARLQGIGADEIAGMGSHPAQGAVAPMVVAARGGVFGVEGHHRQEFQGRDSEIPQVGQGVDQPQQSPLALGSHRAPLATGEAPHMQLIDDASLPGVARAGRLAEVKAIPLRHHALQAAGGVGDGPHGRAASEDAPSGQRAGAGIDEHLGRVEAMIPRLQGTEHPVAIAGADADSLHLHMPVIPGPVLPLQGHDRFGFLGLAVGEQQQLHPRGQGGHDREVHPPRGHGCPQRPGISNPDHRPGRRGWSQTRLLLVSCLCSPWRDRRSPHPRGGRADLPVR